MGESLYVKGGDGSMSIVRSLADALRRIGADDPDPYLCLLAKGGNDMLRAQVARMLKEPERALFLFRLEQAVMERGGGNLDTFLPLLSDSEMELVRRLASLINPVGDMITRHFKVDRLVYCRHHL